MKSPGAFDVDLLREMSARQEADARRIVDLCDAVRKLAEENAKLRAQLEKPAAPAAPVSGNEP